MQCFYQLNISVLNNTVAEVIVISALNYTDG